MSALLEASGLGKSFGGLQALADLSFSVEAGQVFGLIGPNGSREHPHQRCFPGAVAAQQSDALPGLDVAMDTVQEGRTAVPQMHITKSNKWHRDQNNRLWKQTLENLKAV